MCSAVVLSWPSSSSGIVRQGPVRLELELGSRHSWLNGLFEHVTQSVTWRDSELLGRKSFGKNLSAKVLRIVDFEFVHPPSVVIHSYICVVPRGLRGFEWVLVELLGTEGFPRLCFGFPNIILELCLDTWCLVYLVIAWVFLNVPLCGS